MNAEYLLYAIGCLDDDLIGEAEQAAPAPRRSFRLGSWAAALALCVGLGALTLRGGLLKGAESGMSPSPSAPSANEPASSLQGVDPLFPNFSGGSQTNDFPSGEGTGPEEPATPGSAVPPASDASCIYIEDTFSPSRVSLVYTVTDEVVSAPPPEAELLGRLSALYPDAPSPATDAENYVGCPVWCIQGSYVPDRVYLYLSDGVWAVAGLVQP